MTEQTGVIGAWDGTPVYESRRLKPLDMVVMWDGPAGALWVGDLRYLKVRVELRAWVKDRCDQFARRFGLGASDV